jgi:hypothetical protein
MMILSTKVFNGVDITRIPLKRRRGGKLSYCAQPLTKEGRFFPESIKGWKLAVSS